MKPGTIVLPLASIRCAPVGMLVDAAGPTAVIRPPETTSVPRSIGARPVPSIIRALVKATVAPAVGACASEGGNASVASASSVPAPSAKMRREERIIGRLPAAREAPPYTAGCKTPPYTDNFPDIFMRVWGGASRPATPVDLLRAGRLARLRREQLREV